MPKYVAPAVTDLGNETPAIVLPEGSIDHSHCGDLKFPHPGDCPAAAVVAAPAVTPAIKEPNMAPEVIVVGLSKMVNAKGTAVTDLMVARIDRHMQYLAGTVGFNSTAEAHEEQISFMETVGNSLQLDFPAYVVVTDYLLKSIRENQKVFTDGMAYRFMVGLEKRYPSEHSRTYQGYMELLSKIGFYWKERYKLAKLVDYAYTIAPMDSKAKTNVTQYFRKMSSI